MVTPLAWLAPHVPTLLVDEHRAHRTEMLDALAGASHALLESGPRAAVVVSARWQSSGPFLVDAGKKHQTLTDYSGFGVEVRYDSDGDASLARAMVEAGTRAGLRVAAANRGIDSGVTVPMHFLAPGRNLRIVPSSVADRSVGECRAWGASIRRTLTAWPEPVAFVVGGLLSFDPHAWQLGREVTVQREFAADPDIGKVILSRAADLDVDLIVMGAYGHSRMRELVMGGVSRTLLSTMTVPVLMSH